MDPNDNRDPSNTSKDLPVYDQPWFFWVVIFICCLIPIFLFIIFLTVRINDVLKVFGEKITNPFATSTSQTVGGPNGTTSGPNGKLTGTALGQKIVSLAEGYIGQTTRPSGPEGNIFHCNNARRSCASFVSTVLTEAGATDKFNTTATAIWRDPNGQVIIDRGQPLDLNKLQPGDVVFFGHGETSNGGLFNHVGIYVGNGQIVDTSSSQTKVTGPRSISVHSGSNSFNGAKRF